MFCDPKAGGCGHAFCYVCGIDWKKHINNHFYCNNYTEEVKKKEKNALKIKEELEIDLFEEEFFKKELEMKNKKFFFYHNKYKEIDISINKYKVLKNTLGEKMSLISTIHNFSLFDLNFIHDAIETVINATKIIKMSYIFGYFMKEGIQKDLFESSEEVLSNNTDTLYYRLADDQLNMLIK